MGFKRKHETVVDASISTLTAEYDQGSERSLGSRLCLGAAAVVAASGLFLGATVHEANLARARADDVVGFGGMGDTSGIAYGDMLRAAGQLGPDDTYYPVPYPASIAPMGPVTLEQSLNEAMINSNPVIEEARRNVGPGEKLVISGYSEGGMAAARKARELYGDYVTPGTVVIDGAPVADTGLFNNQEELVQQFLPVVTEMLDIPTHDRAPAGSILRHSEQDVWANGGGSNLGELIQQGMDSFMGPAHAVQNANAPYNEWVGQDGVIHHEYPGTGTGGPAPGGVTMGGPAPAPANLAPGSIDGVGIMQDLGMGGPAPAPAPAPAPVEPVRLPAPSFWGEQPCFAEDGSQYWTPGDAPC